MCGIVGYAGSHRAEEVVVDGLRRMEYRGYDSAGYALGVGGALLVNKDVGRVHGLTLFGVSSDTGIGHTRWATHGKPTRANAHPHLSYDGRVAVVHNGVVENAEELKARLFDDGIRFASETDSEVIAHLVAQKYCDCKDAAEAIRGAAAELSGAYSFVVLFAGDSTVYCYRHRTSLLVGLGKGENLVASDMLALAPYAEKALILADDELGEIRAGSVRVTRHGTPVEKSSVRVCAESLDVTERCFMEKEIREIPFALQRTKISIAEGLSEIPKEVLLRAREIVFCACGTAYHAGLFGKYIFANVAGRRAVATIASEAEEELQFADENTLAVFVSQSGETSDTLGALRRAKSRGATTLALTNVRGSSIAFEADYTLFTDAGAEIAVAATKSYNSQLLALYMLALHTKNLDCNREGAPSLAIDRLVDAAKELVLADCESLFSDYIFGYNYFYIGRGVDLVTAREGALKMKEISYRMTDAYPSGELKHGTLALIDSHSLVVVILTSEEWRGKTETAIAELKSRGAKILLITTLDDVNSDELILLPDLGEELAPLLAVIPLQKLALSTSRALGINPDKPRNLAKSVTVD